MLRSVLRAKVCLYNVSNLHVSTNGWCKLRRVGTNLSVLRAKVCLYNVSL